MVLECSACGKLCRCFPKAGIKMKDLQEAVKSVDCTCPNKRNFKVVPLKQNNHLCEPTLRPDRFIDESAGTKSIGIPKLMTIAEAARHLNVSRYMIGQMLKAKTIPHTKFDGDRMISVSSLETALQDLSKLKSAEALIGERV